MHLSPTSKLGYLSFNLNINVLIATPDEATPLERPLFWNKMGGLTRGVPL